jgi:hypothetical protein
VVLHAPGCEKSPEGGTPIYCRISHQIPPLPLRSLSPRLFSSLILIQSKSRLDPVSQLLLEVTPLCSLAHPPAKTRCTTIAPPHHAPHSSYASHPARLSPERIGTKAPKFYCRSTWRCKVWQRTASKRLNFRGVELCRAHCFESACERRCRRSLTLIVSRD